MILAGDVGGTKTMVALFDDDGTAKEAVLTKTYASRDHRSLESVVESFLREARERPTAAAFGVAGPVRAGAAKITNLPWQIEARAIADRFRIPAVHLINDLQAVAADVPHLDPEDYCTLSAGEPEDKGAIAVVAPGTGLGESFLVWAGDRYRAYPTEGGHASFGPNSHDELDLLVFLERRFGHVSYERVCCGSGIPNIYDFLLETSRHEAPGWLVEELRSVSDRTPVICRVGLAGEAEICVAVLTLFTQVLGGVIGNMALKVMATGGVFLAGGMPRRLLPRLQQPDLLASMRDKGRFSEMMARVPVHVILDSAGAALRGAAWYARTAA